MANGNTQSLCFMCGTAHGNRVRKQSGIRIGVENYWDWILGEYDLDKPFGIEFGTGKAGIANQERFDIEDPRADRFIEPMRKLMLLAVQRAIRIGLVAKEELVEAIDQEST